MTNARLFTVRIEAVPAGMVGRDGLIRGTTLYECEFAGIRFSRTNESDVIHWVRVAARKRYGSQAQVIFLRETEGN